MQTTGKSNGDGVLGAAVAVAVNALIAWQLQALLAPTSTTAPDAAATTALDVVWIAVPPRRDRALAKPARPRLASARAVPAIQRPHSTPAKAIHDPAPTDPPADLPLARPMAAVYLRQAGEWARNHPIVAVPVDPFARRPMALADLPASRFRLKRQVSVADAVAMVGVVFGNPPHPCVRNPDDLAGYATGGDALALQMALAVDRQCRP